MDATNPSANNKKDKSSTETAESAALGSPSKAKGADKPASQRREISGNLVYTTTPGALKSVLDALIKAEVPEKVTQDFISTVLGIKGGSAAQQLPVLKKIGLVSGEGKPTDRYSRFRSDMNRSAAALEALRTGYAAIFQKNTFAHKLSESEIRDIAAEVTGLKKTDSIIGYICATFERLRACITDKNVSIDTAETTEEQLAKPSTSVHEINGIGHAQLGLSYVINLVLPHSNNIETYNLIFRSLRENILDWSR